MILAWLLLLTGLTISAVAIYYSVVGLAAIFSAAVIPIIVMGSALEVAKLVCASWLKANWNHAPRLMKIYMTTAVAVLMLITSMGIFGFLSKAHSDQSLVSGDVTAKISIYDEKIRTAKDNIDANRKALKQMDEAVDQVMGRSNDEKGADKAVAIRRSQAKDRTRLQQEIAAEQKTISALNDEAAPIRAEVRKVEAEVGPLKYIAAFVYGATDESVLERAVTWVIITIIIVFDPLAVIMLLAAQMTFGWKKEEEEEVPLLHDTVPVYVTDVTMPEPEELVEEQETHTDVPSETPLTALGGDITAPEEPEVPNTSESELEKWNKMIDEAEKAVEAELRRGEDLLQLEEAKEEPAKTSLADLWGEPAPERVKPDLTEVVEPEDSKKKDLHDQGSDGSVTSEDEGVSYVQNSEQGDSTLWARIMQRSGARSKDELYRLYSSDVFDTLEVDETTDPELAKFVKETKTKGPRFNNYTAEKIENFVSRIYELRKDNGNNTAG